MTSCKRAAWSYPKDLSELGNRLSKAINYIKREANGPFISESKLV